MPSSTRGDTALIPAVSLDSLEHIGAALSTRPYARRGVAPSPGMIRVLLVDDHTIVRQGLKALLGGLGDIAVIGEAATGHQALSIAEQLAPDVVVMDLDMPDGDGLEATRDITAIEHPPKVLVLTMYAEEEYLIPLLRQGASGFLSKEAAARELADAIRAVCAGEVYVRPSVARLLAASVRPKPSRTPADLALADFARLSEREQTVLRMIAEGYNGPEIGRELGITAKTVDTYKKRIEEKLGLDHRTSYVRFALTAGLIGA